MARRWSWRWARRCACAGCGLGAGERGRRGRATRSPATTGAPVRLRAADRRRQGVRHGDAGARPQRRDHDPLRRRLRAVDRRHRGRQRRRALLDWFFYVNGVESPVGAADYARCSGGERVWWDYRDWTAAMRVPAVVGSWPQPFARRLRGQSATRSRSSAGAGAAPARWRGAGAAERRRRARAARPRRTRSGSWSAPGRGCARDPAAAQIEDGPQASGVFADFEPARRRLSCSCGLDRGRASRRASFGAGAGLVAATRRYDAPPVWVVTGDRRGRRCARRPQLLDARRPARPLRGRDRGRDGDPAAAAMRSPFAYTPRPGAAAGGLARRRGRLPRRPRRGRLPLLEPAGARRRRGRAPRSPACSAGARRAVRAALRMGLDAGAADRRRQRASSSTAARRCWPGSASGRCSARSTSPPRRSPPAR